MENLKLDAPVKFTKQGVIEFLQKKGATAILDTQAVAMILDRTPQTIRKYAKSGELPCDMSVWNRAVYKLDDLADFIIKHPSLFGVTKQSFELTDSTIELIRQIAYKHWRPLLDAIGAEDVIANVQCKLLNTRNIRGTENVGSVIQGILSHMYRDWKKSVKTVSIEDINGEI